MCIYHRYPYLSMTATGLGRSQVMLACLVALYRDPGRYTMNHKAFWKALQEIWVKNRLRGVVFMRFLDRHPATFDAFYQFFPPSPKFRKEYDLDRAWEKLMASVDGDQVLFFWYRP